MIGLAPLLIGSALWAAALFAVALWGERHGERLARFWPLIYALSLAVYCTAWTFYGTVSQAAQWGSPLPPTFIGTIILFALGLPFLRRLAALARAQNSASIADLVAARFGKSSALAATLTFVSVLGVVPYVALQLKAVAQSFSVLAGFDSGAGSGWQDAALWVALLMSAFAMLFGTRRAAATAHNRGLMLAMAAESLLKLGAMLALGWFVMSGLYPNPDSLWQASRSLPAAGPGGGFVALVLLGALAMVTLPHQFHVGVVELRDPQHLRTARWLFPVYLLLIALPTLPLAWAGQLRIGDAVPSDLHVLALPLAADRPGLALLAFIGGLSAATGMVVMAVLTLSIMIAQHWLAPLLLRGEELHSSHDLRPRVLAQRRLAIAGVMGLAWLYSRAMAESDALADIGALSFSALAQLAPAVWAAVYRPKVPPLAVLLGVLVGTAVWAWLLLLPALSPAAQPAHQWDPLLLGTVSSLLANAATIALLSLRPARVGRIRTGGIAAADLRQLAARLLPGDEVMALFHRADGDTDADPELIAEVEHALAGVVGGASARLLVQAAHRGRSAPLAAVAEVVGETSRALRFNQNLLEAALENMSQGISVVDGDLRLVAWNRRYAELFAYPPHLLAVGVEVAELVRHNAERGLLGESPGEGAVVRRLAHMLSGTPYVTERRFPDGQVVEIRGNPMPGGGFVATFTDVTDFRAAELALTAAKATLEERVQARTAELAQAKAEAERANQAKSRFLASVSHDLLQPIHAAHLFTHALKQRLHEGDSVELATQVESSLGASESLLAGLLDISRLDAGGLSPQLRDFALDELLQQLVAEFAVLAAERGLSLRSVATRAWVRSDPQLLRRVLQNFLSNAVRYTERGRILIGCRRHGKEIAVVVLDTGPGIAEADQPLVFEEFHRLGQGGPGLGLGLAIAERTARLLGHPITLRSRSGSGTAFAVALPRVGAGSSEPAPVAQPRSRLGGHLLLVDNDSAVLKATQALVEGWGFVASTARTEAQACAIAAAAEPQDKAALKAVILDYHLDSGRTGLELLTQLRPQIGNIPVIVITADHAEQTRDLVRAAGCQLLHKPLKPLALKSLLARLTARAAV
ncbi:MAG: PAS domain-containing hybrid sensor histidine kinase/response regulator [Xanthomonadales bacterium]|nr:PAS domain-containing hybrid sensor histidine kinase/response regulator [Xanthomonadales bacterium]